MNDFLAQSESESVAGRFKPVAMDIVALCRNIVSEMESVSKGGVPGRINKNIRESEIIINGDTKLLRHIFRNLISNAIKYSSDDHSAIMITIDVENGNAVIEITDNGIGIPEEEIEQLFTPFFRASNATKISGTGVGLSIVKEFVELHGGTITVHSYIGIGSTFTVRLPIITEPVQRITEEGERET